MSSFKFSLEHEKNWKIMLEALQDVVQKEKPFYTNDSDICPCGHFLRKIRRYRMGYDIEKAVQKYFGFDYYEGPSDLKNFFNGCGPSNASDAIKLGKKLLKKYGVTQAPTVSTKGKVTIKDCPRNNVVLFTSLNLGEPFRYEKEIWIKSENENGGSDFATCLNDGYSGSGWDGIYVELVDIEVVVS